MKNYISIGGAKVPLSDEQMESIRAQFMPDVRLGDKAVAETAKVGEHEYIVLAHGDGTTMLLMRDFLTKMRFGDSNDFRESDIKETLEKFADELASVVGEDNIITHSVDLTADDGLKCYGEIDARVSMFTCDLARKYVDILDKYPVDDYWWLVTPYSTPKHGDSDWVKCVSPSGGFNDGNSYGDFGVRPFCILNSNIFVS